MTRSSFYPRSVKQQLAFAACLAVSGVASAATTWTATDWNLACANTVPVVGSTPGVAAAGTWGSCGGVDVRGTTINASNGTTTVFGVSDSTVKAWDGLGVINQFEDINAPGPHALDGYRGLDALVLRFGNLVSLSDVQIGWWSNGTTYNDTDVGVYRWKEEVAPTATSQLGRTNSGWELVASLTNLKTEPEQTKSFTTDKTSSYWMVSALDATNSSTGADAFKLLSIAGYVVTTTTGVPEPGSLALLCLGAAGLLAARRKSVARR